MTRSNITEAIYRSLEQLGYACEALAPTADLEATLGIDSLEMVELAALACRGLGLPPQVTADVRDVHTVTELAARIAAVLEPALEPPVQGAA